MKETDIVIVGFGFSAIPLLRELDLRDQEYTIISEKAGSIWANLERSDALDFDLVSSYYSSWYTFDLVKDFSGGSDRYPTAREFYDMHLRYYRKYEDQIVEDFVTHIEEKDDYNLVHTRQGDCYKANKVVISTAFQRKVHESLKHLDYDAITNKTVVLNTIGDSANLIISKLITRNNNIVCLQDGFLPLDKLLQVGKIKYSLEQLEAHEIAKYFKSLYGNVIDTNYTDLFEFYPRQKVGAILASLTRKVRDLLGKLFTPYNFHVDFAGTRRGFEADREPESPIPNAVSVIKYWPIDQYFIEFSDCLEESIQKGFLLNDITFFASEGLLKFWSKKRTTVNEAEKTIECNGEKLHYDYFIDGDAETPRLPGISYHKDGETREFCYQYRNGYLGVIQRDLKNIYLLGYTRPATGGLSNITEMQSLLIHKMVSDKTFYTNMRDGLDAKIEKYNQKYYPLTEPGPRDHIAYFGFYTEEVAQELGINITLKSCKGIKEIAKYLTYPNSADKYRQKGEYKIEKADQFVEHVYKEHKGFERIWESFMCYVGYYVVTIGVATSLFLHDWINGYVYAGAIGFQLIFGYWMMILVTNSAPFFRVKLLLQLVYLPMLLNPLAAAMILPIDFIITFIMRQLPGARYQFNDLKNKKRYRSFYQRYKETYNRLKTYKHPEKGDVVETV